VKTLVTSGYHVSIDARKPQKVINWPCIFCAQPWKPYNIHPEVPNKRGCFSGGSGFTLCPLLLYGFTTYTRDKVSLKDVLVQDTNQFKPTIPCVVLLQWKFCKEWALVGIRAELMSLF